MIMKSMARCGGVMVGCGGVIVGYSGMMVCCRYEIVDGSVLVRFFMLRRIIT